MFKMFIRKKLESYVKRYLKTHADIKLVIIVGSVGKTSTKMAIGTVLSEKFRIRMHEGNHNSEISAPLAMLGIDFPVSLRSPGAWLSVFKAAKNRISLPSDVDVIVQEVGSDGIGQVPHFGTFAKPNIAVVTAVSPEHMKFFKTIDAVAREELSAVNFSIAALINRDDIDDEFAKYITNAHINTYGTSAASEYHFVDEGFTVGKGYNGKIVVADTSEPIPATINVLGEHSLRPAIAGAAVGLKLGLTADEIKKGLAKIRAVSGRMNVLRGFDRTMIIDDTYNSSPLAAASALRALYNLNTPTKIAVLGSMNELGADSVADHTVLGELCDPNQLAWVVTVGKEANEQVAPAARARGCQVKSFDNALQAGAFVHSVAEPGAAILFKGSEGGIYLEEAVKIVLHSTDDEDQLVRQSSAWIARKDTFFRQFAKQTSVKK
jgi:UDP-N-acetylmuramoyl-tripeptide--D-alanyl-D-alanine ligase